MAHAMTLPPVPVSGNLAAYLRDIRKFPLLSPEEERALAETFRDTGDPKAAHRLVTSHLRLVVKIALGFRGYPVPLEEVIAEGNLGVMRAVKTFEPERGLRFSTYAMWWIRAAIQEYVLASWSLVRIGRTAAQKRLFYHLRRVKKAMGIEDRAELSPAESQAIAKKLKLREVDVIDLNRRLLGGDLSLNAPTQDGEGQIQDLLADEGQNQEVLVAERQEKSWRQRLLAKAMERLNPRERDILTNRRLREVPLKLEDLSQKYNISRERVRQIENQAFEKLRRELAACPA